MANLKIKQIPEDDEVGRILHKEMTDEFQKRYVLYGEEETSMPVFYENFAESIENFEVRDSDVWVASFPKTGTTWTQEMVWMIVNNLDFESAKEDVDVRFPFLEICTLYDFEKLGEAIAEKSSKIVSDSVQYVKELESPRFIKTHLPVSLLPQQLRNGTKTAKMIYVMRNPKDTCVSYYHHCRLLQGCRANLEDFTKVFLADKAMYGSYWKHILGYWEYRNSENVLIITYEDMKKDLPSVIQKVAQFLGKTLTSEQVEILAKHLSFESMKKNPAVNGADFIEIRKQKNLAIGDGTFIRSGTVGQYKEELSTETIKKFDTWIKNSISGSSFAKEYNYDL